MGKHKVRILGYHNGLLFRFNFHNKTRTYHTESERRHYKQQGIWKLKHV